MDGRQTSSFISIAVDVSVCSGGMGVEVENGVDSVKVVNRLTLYTTKPGFFAVC